MIRKTKDGYVTDVFMNQQHQTNNADDDDDDGGHRSGARTKLHKHNKSNYYNNSSRDNGNGHRFSTSTAASHGMTPSKKFRKQAAAAANDDDDGDGTGLFNRSPDKRRVVDNDSDNYLTDCIFFLQGRCTKGSDCEFRHSEVAKTNNRACKFWSRGTCHVLECVYRHPSRNVPICTFYMQGKCSKGTSCTFLHTGTRPPPAAESVPSASVGTQKITIQFEQDDDLLHEQDDVIPSVSTADDLSGIAYSKTVLDSSPTSKVGTKRARNGPTNNEDVSTAADILQANKKARPSSLDALSGTSQGTHTTKKEVPRTATATLDFEQEMAYIDQLLADE